MSISRAHLHAISGEHKRSTLPYVSIYRCKVVVMTDGFPRIMNYIGPWKGWKSIDPEAAPISWRIVR